MKLHTPRLTELETARHKVGAEKAVKVAEATVLRAQIQQSPSGGNVADNRVRAILGEAPLPEVAPDMSRLETILVEVNDLNRALGILDGKIQAEKSVASKLLCEAEKPEVTKRGKAFAKAYVDLHTAQLEYHSYLDKIRDTGASASSLPHVFLSGLGDAKDRSGQFMYGMKEFVEAGYLAQSEMPKVLFR